MIAVIAALLAAGWYAWASQQYHRRFPAKRVLKMQAVAYYCGCAVLAIVLSPSFDGLADESFAWHMVQHVAIALVAAPLLLMGAPLLYLLGTLPRNAARILAKALNAQPLSTLFSPVCAWLCFVAFLWISHFSGLYNAALDNEWIHAAEHAAYVGLALLFWSAVVQTGFVPHPLGYGTRMLYIFLAIPQGAFLGVALFMTRAPLYAHYVAANGMTAALADQHNAGAVMWVGGGLLFFGSFMLTAATWAARERSRAAIGAAIRAASLILCVLALRAPAAAAIALPVPELRQPATLYATQCASCHGALGQGSNLAPSLIGVPEVYVHFMLDTGRMPAQVPYVQVVHTKPSFTPHEIDQLTAYIAGTLSKTSPRGLPVVAPGNVDRGRELFSINCQQCHGAGGAGEAIGYGYQRVAPSLREATPMEVAEAIRSGPGVMPRFGDKVLTDRDVDDIAQYVHVLTTQDTNPGGISLSNIGAAAEGLVAWVFGVGFLVILLRRLSLAGGTLDEH